MEIIKMSVKDGYLISRQRTSELMALLGIFFGSSLYGMVDYVKDLLSSHNGVFNSNSIYLSREGDSVTIEINTLIESEAAQRLVPYIKFINLLDKWKVICELTKAPDEIIILMDDDYNFDVCYEYGNDLTKVKID